mgnify:CR=1 FL=1
MANFWKEIKSPFFVLAPMEDVTDTVFRQIIASIAKPDVFFTEFANVDAIINCSTTLLPPPNLGGGIKGGGIHPGLQRLVYSQLERPIVAQIWGTEPTKFYQAAKLIKRVSFDGIDINLGCPQRKIIKTGSCAALIGQNKLVGEIIAATVEGVGGLPVSVKTRIGIEAPITEDWVGFLLTQNLAAITIHARTAAEKSEVPAHWDEIAKAVRVKRMANSKSLIVGNGDVSDLRQATSYCRDYGVDGVMIGRGIFTNPAVFDKSGRILTPDEKLQLFARHIKLYRRTWGQQKNLHILKKFAKTYISGWSGAAVMRERLSRARSYDQLVTSLSGYLGVDEKLALF